MFTNHALYPEMADQMHPVYVGLAIMYAAPAIAGFMLWVFAESIVGRSGASSETNLDDKLGQRDIVAIGTYLIGIYVLVFGIVHALEWESYLQVGPAMIPEFDGFTDSSGALALSKRIAYSGQIVLGVALVMIGKRH